MAGFVAVAHHFPALAPEISLILRRWPLADLIGKNGLRAGFWPPGARSPTTYTDAHLGYEQYAARAADLIGLPARHLLDPRRTLVEIADETGLLPAENRRATPDPVVTPDPLLLDALEFGWRADMLAQVRRHWRKMQPMRPRWRRGAFRIMLDGPGGTR